MSHVGKSPKFFCKRQLVSFSGSIGFMSQLRVSLVNTTMKLILAG